MLKSGLEQANSISFSIHVSIQKQVIRVCTEVCVHINTVINVDMDCVCTGTELQMASMSLSAEQSPTSS